MGVAHFKLAKRTLQERGAGRATANANATANATRFIIAVGRKGGVRDSDCVPGVPCAGVAFPLQWAAMHAWNQYDLRHDAASEGSSSSRGSRGSRGSTGSSIVVNGVGPGSQGRLNAGITTMISSASLSVHSVGLTETRFEVALPPGSLEAEGAEVEFYIALPQGGTCWAGMQIHCGAADTGAVVVNGSLPTHADFAAAEKAVVRSWDAMYGSTDCKFVFPSGYWNQHVDIWLAQVASLARASNDPLHLHYGAGEVYGDDFEGVEEGWEPRAMDYFGFTAEGERETGVLLNTEYNLNRTIKGAQYRNGLAQHYAVSHALLSGDAEWIRKIAPTLVANTNWTAQQRRIGVRDSTTKGQWGQFDSARSSARTMHPHGACVQMGWRNLLRKIPTRKFLPLCFV